MNKFEIALREERAKAGRALETAAPEIRQRLAEIAQAVRLAIGAGDALNTAERAFLLGVLSAEARLEPLARKGEAFSDRKRGLSRLYRLAIEVLEGDCAASTQHVVDVLRAAREVWGGEHGMLLWKDDQGRQRRTCRAEFAKRLSVHRARLRSRFPAKASEPTSPGRAPSVILAVVDNDDTESNA